MFRNTFSIRKWSVNAKTDIIGIHLSQENKNIEIRKTLTKLKKIKLKQRK